MNDFSVLLVATNKYVGYAGELIHSIQQNLFTKSSGQVLLFTDQPNLFENLSNSRVQVQTVKIPSYGWPEATLLRYEFFEDNWDQVDGDIVMYLDVDTKVVAKVQLDDAIEKSKDYSLSMVRHPGYFKNSIVDFLIARGPKGTWETNPHSKAFVPFYRRKIYVAGGVWLGTKKAIYEMVRQLRKNVQDDLNNEIIAKWHDESHLNYWSTRNKVKYLTPAWAYAPGYDNISSHDPIIELIHKDDIYFEQRD